MRILISGSADKLSFKMVCLITFSLLMDYICKAEVTLLVSYTTYKDNHVVFFLLIYKLNFQYFFTSTLFVCFHQHIIWARLFDNVMLSIFQIDVLEDMLVHQQRLKVYEMLQHGVAPQVC